MTDETKNIININGTEYDQNSFDENQKYYIKQVQDAQIKSATLRFQLDQVLVVQEVFTNKLIESLNPKKETNEQTDNAKSQS